MREREEKERMEIYNYIGGEERKWRRGGNEGE